MTFTLDRGPHESPGRGVCAAEATAWLAGEPRGDEPATLCPVLGKAVRWVNDLMDDAGRTLLAPLVPQMVATRSPAHMAFRARVIADGICAAILDDDSALETALDWIESQPDADDALARMEAEDAPLAHLCAEVLYGGAFEIVTQALTWLDSAAATGDRERLWPGVVVGIERAVLSGPHAEWHQGALRRREAALTGLQGPQRR